MGRECFIKTYPKSRPVRHAFTETYTHTHTGRESHLCVSFIGADTLPCSSEWDLMSEAPACDSPMGQPLVRAENGGNITKEGSPREGGTKEGKGCRVDSLRFAVRRMRGEIGKSPLRRTLSEDQCSGLALPISPALSTHLSSVSNNLYPRRPQHSSRRHVMQLCWK